MAAQGSEPNVDVGTGVVPYILSPDAGKHIKWLKAVFDARVKCIFSDEATKKVVHAAVDMNGGTVYFSDGSCLPNQQSSELPAETEVRGIVTHLNLQDPHPIWKKALINGAKVVVELQLQFWGDMYGSFRDPFGYEWALCSPSPIAKEPESADQAKENQVPEKK